MDECLSETIASFNSPKTPRNENEAEVYPGSNTHEDGEPEIAVSKSKVMTTIHVHDIDGITITEMGYQGDDEEMESENVTGKLFHIYEWHLNNCKGQDNHVEDINVDTIFEHGAFKSTTKS